MSGQIWITQLQQNKIKFQTFSTLHLQNLKLNCWRWVIQALTCQTFGCQPGSPGLVVMRRDSRSKGREFEPRHRILDGHFSTYICCKNCIDVCLKRPKINKKMPGLAHLKKNYFNSLLLPQLLSWNLTPINHVKFCNCNAQP